MEIVAKENMVSVMDHEAGHRTEEFVEDPMQVPRRISEEWSPQFLDELPNAFCGIYIFFLKVKRHARGPPHSISDG